MLVDRLFILRSSRVVRQGNSATARLTDRQFEFHGGHGCSFLLLVVLCVVSGFCDGLISLSEESYDCVCVCDIETAVRRSESELGCCTTERKYRLVGNLIPRCVVNCRSI